MSILKKMLFRIKIAENCEDLADSDLIIEAVFEDFKVKSERFRKLDSVCRDKTILATNTSTFSVAELSEKISRRDRFVGPHFFYHPAMNRLLEIIPGPKTSPATSAICEQLFSLMDKISIVVEDVPGFAANRFFVP